MSDTNAMPVVAVEVPPAPIVPDRFTVIEARLAALELCNGIRPVESA